MIRMVSMYQRSGQCEPWWYCCEPDGRCCWQWHQRHVDVQYGWYVVRQWRSWCYRHCRAGEGANGKHQSRSVLRVPSASRLSSIRPCQMCLTKTWLATLRGGFGAQTRSNFARRSSITIPRGQSDPLLLPEHGLAAKATAVCHGEQTTWASGATTRRTVRSRPSRWTRVRPL